MSKEEDLGIDLKNFFKEEEIAKFKDIEPKGWTLLVRLYIEPEVTKGGIILMSSTQQEGEYKNCVGLVVKKSKAAYLDSRYEQTGSWCEIGDWVVFPRHAGYKIYYNKIPVFVLKEDAIDAVISDPTIINR